MTSITLVRRIRASQAIVFDALSTVEGLTSWWGPDDLPVISAEADIRVGGGYRVRFRRHDGEEHECAGQFLEIVERERIVMSWQWTSGGDPDEVAAEQVSRVEMHFRPIDTGTELTLVHANLTTAASAQAHDGGWAGALDKLVRIYDRP
jgi:uncharacterized protein YndB with AHSA1/START domain